MKSAEICRSTDSKTEYEPLISVIIPVYKVEEYLDECMSSVVGQTYENLEIILVDDGSPDRCPMMCDEWAAKDSRIKVIHKENGGLSDARNAGLEIAAGEYIGFVDSDDRISADFFEILITAVKENEAQIAASSVIAAYEDREELRDEILDQKVFSSEEAMKTFLDGKAFFCVAWNKLYAKSCFEGIRFPVGKINEDEFVIYRVMAKADKLALCQSAKYYYRQRGGSIMSSQVKIDNFDFLEAYSERLSFFKDNFPELYSRDKAGFCVACTARYRTALAKKADKKTLEKIALYRRQVNFRLSELPGYKLKDIFYILGSGISIDIFSRILNLRGTPD